jgi:hypothetical protein
VSSIPRTSMDLNDPSGTNIRVAINEGGFAFASDSLHIFMGLKFSDGDIRIMRIGDEGRSTLEMASPLEATGPTMIIPRDFAIVLMNALLKHFEGASDMHTLRSDFLHERGRVDKMMEHVLFVAGKALDKVPDGTDI